MFGVKCAFSWVGDFLFPLGKPILMSKTDTITLFQQNSTKNKKTDMNKFEFFQEYHRIKVNKIIREKYKHKYSFKYIKKIKTLNINFNIN